MGPCASFPRATVRSIGAAFSPRSSLAAIVFCPNDKVMLKPVAGVMTCPKCGYQKKQVVGENVVKQKSVDDISKSVMADATQKMDLLPTTNEYACEKCGNGTAYYFMRQTRSADEATTRFLECTKCGYKWREYR
jgi:transcription factor S